jgi:hypothetical protein
MISEKVCNVSQRSNVWTIYNYSWQVIIYRRLAEQRLQELRGDPDKLRCGSHSGGEKCGVSKD